MEIARKIGMVTLNSVTTIKKQFYGAGYACKKIFFLIYYEVFSRDWCECVTMLNGVTTNENKFLW